MLFVSFCFGFYKIMNFIYFFCDLERKVLYMWDVIEQKY